MKEHGKGGIKMMIEGMHQKSSKGRKNAITSSKRADTQTEREGESERARDREGVSERENEAANK